MDAESDFCCLGCLRDYVLKEIEEKGERPGVPQKYAVDFKGGYAMTPCVLCRREEPTSLMVNGVCQSCDSNGGLSFSPMKQSVVYHVLVADSERAKADGSRYDKFDLNTAEVVGTLELAKARIVRNGLEWEDEDED